MTQQQEGQVDLVARIYQGNRTEPGYSALVNTLPIEGRLGAGQAQFQLGPEAYVPSGP